MRARNRDKIVGKWEKNKKETFYFSLSKIKTRNTQEKKNTLIRGNTKKTNKRINENKYILSAQMRESQSERARERASEREREDR